MIACTRSVESTRWQGNFQLILPTIYFYTSYYVKRLAAEISLDYAIPGTWYIVFIFIGFEAPCRPPNMKIGHDMGGAFTRFVPQIAPDKVPNAFHFRGFLAVFVMGFFCFFFVKSREGVDPP